ncbi:sulfurtransferase complex subunit TusB [Marinobacter sp. VGCF2001]|uniref:sulfurtransferase complex subunit TusB n=1 Tax=Marinobacter sp. VGCF2001 TaxID=3417189 RepID=UPI003CF69CAE
MMPDNVKNTLHIINKAPEHPRFRRCLDCIQPSDTLLLIEDAVLALADGGQQLPAAVHALDADITARALGNRVPGGLLVDYAGFVELTVNHPRIINW